MRQPPGELLGLSGPVSRIVVLRANNIGDFVAGVPALRALRAAFPDARITHVGSAKVRAFVERLPAYIDRFLEFPGFPGIRDRGFDAREVVAFLGERQRERYDLAIQMHGNGVWANPFLALFGARRTVGFRRAEDAAEFLGLDHALVFDEARHETLRLLDLLASIGVASRGTQLELPIRPADEAEAAEVLRAAGVDPARPLLGVHAGGRFPDRMWPPERFAAAADALAADRGFTVVLTGNERDAAVNREVRAAMHSDAIDLAGRLSLPGLVALVDRLSLFVTNDTGPAHVAYARGTPSVTLFGASPPATWGPLDRTRHAAVEAEDPCRPCGPDPCIRRIPVAAVVNAADMVLDEAAAA